MNIKLRNLSTVHLPFSKSLKIYKILKKILLVHLRFYEFITTYSFVNLYHCSVS